MVGSKKKVFLHRKLPSAVHLQASSFVIRAEAREKSQSEVAGSLADILETELESKNRELHVDKQAPELVITCTVTRYDVPPPQSFTRNEVVLEKGHQLEEPKKFYRLAGTLDVAYQAKDSHSGKILDSENVTGKYSREYEEGANQAGDKALSSKLMDPFKRAAGKKTADSSGPPTALDIREDLIRQVVSQIAMSLVNTDETVEVLLARGKLDSANKLAQADLWSRYLETLETMTPFPNPKDDAYRWYNIGVANEALAYQSEDETAARKFLDQAAIDYGKAIDAKPEEKYFHEPQMRIETAAAHYRRLRERHENASLAPSPTPAKSAAASTTQAKADQPAPESNGKPAPALAKKSANTGPRKLTSATGVTSATLKQQESTLEPQLTNEKVIEMFKSGVDEENIIATIRQSARVRFDISPDGQIQLAKNGVKGKILAAMRERARRARPSEQ